MHSYSSAILSALPVFEAAARLGNFSQAARELGLTQSAVSRRVKTLEDQLGVILFTRTGRMLAITADGQRLADTAIDAIRLVEDMQARLGNPLAGTLRIGVLPSLGSLWLAPRIKRFQTAHPGISVSVESINGDFSSAHKDPVTWDPSTLDVVLTWGRGGWQTLKATRLNREEMVPVCAPDFSDALDIWDAPHLVHKTRPDAWQGYYEAQGRAAGKPSADVTLAFEHFYMIVEAAKAGAGAALLPSLLVAGDVAAGRLVTTGPAWKTGYIYAALASEAALARPAVKAFVAWVTAEAAP